MKLRRGDIVELRSPAEILATLDDDGCLEGVPFMPEMLRYFGIPLTVSARVERACDTIERYEARRMPDTVLLEELRCDGSAHGGCQAGCRLYWKEVWLRQVSPDARRTPDEGAALLAELETRVRDNTRVTRSTNGREHEVYRCQATEFLRGTEPLGWYDPKSFLRELTCGNIDFRPWLRVTLRAVRVAVSRKLRLRMPEPFHPHGTKQTTAADSDLAIRPGEKVRVKSRAEIEQTLDATGKTRGLGFDREMLPYCDEIHTVKYRVERFIDDRTGELIELKSDAFILDAVVCSGLLSENRWFCPRGLYPWWRGCWLHSVDEQSPGSVE
jgi:hypothetical protein